MSRVEETYTICCLYRGAIGEQSEEWFKVEVMRMSGGIILQNRDIELLIFLGKYKIMSLDNTKYIYETKTYQEKRIVSLVRHNYVKRLKHRYITLGIKGKEYLLENGFEIRNHCRNENNMERLNVISDIASCLIRDNLNFIPSWNIKKKMSQRHIQEDI